MKFRNFRFFLKKAVFRDLRQNFRENAEIHKFIISPEIWLIKKHNFIFRHQERKIRRKYFLENLTRKKFGSLGATLYCNTK